MYRIYNKAFDTLLPKYGVHSIDELTNDQLGKLAETLGLHSVPRQDEKTKKFFGFDRDKSMKMVEDYLTFSLYMGDGYWEEKHLKKVQDAEIDSRLGKMKTGDEVFEIMARHKLGFAKLRPGSSADVDWTERYMEEFFKKVPFFKWCEVTSLETGKVYTPDKEAVAEETTPKTAPTPESTVEALAEALSTAQSKLEEDIESLKYQDLVALARKRGIEKPNFKTRDMLIKLLK